MDVIEAPASAIDAAVRRREALVDALGQALHGLATGIDHLLLRTAGDVADEDLCHLRRLTTEAVHLLAEVADGEQPRIRAQSLDRRLRRLGREFGQLSGSTVSVHVHGDARRIPAPVADAVVACTREVLRNVNRHARATVSVIRLRTDETSVSLDIADDGVDLCQRQAGSWRSSVDVALRRLTRAVAAVDGRLVVRRLDPRGLRVAAVIPLGGGRP